MIDNFLKDFKPLKIPLLGVRLPQIFITEEIKKKFDIKADNNDEFLRQLSLLGFKTLKLKKEDPKERAAILSSIIDSFAYISASNRMD